MASRFRAALTRGALACSVAMLGALVLSAPVAAHDANRIYVAPNGSSSNTGDSCRQAQYSSINDGIAAAADHSTVIVCHGEYDEMVVVNKPINLVGRHAAIDANGFDRGIVITSSWSLVARFKVYGATEEGILAVGDGGTRTPIDHVTISHNIVTGNDQGFAGQSYDECMANGQIPGDCGEGIHLMGVADSKVLHNVVANNAGGILLSDEVGPTHGNVIAHNLVQNNPYDCGVTLASHVGGWDPGSQTTTPDFAGVYGNFVRHNVIRNNGLQGEGAGVLMAAAQPLAASYDNVVDHNLIYGNELSGVTIHSHPASATDPIGGYVSGNIIAHNLIGPNNVGSTVVPGDPDAGDFQTTGILVYSSGQPTTVTINHNLIWNDQFGIWLTSSTVSATMHGNVFHNVAVKIENV